MAAARLLQPETQTVKLSSGTLKTEDDVRNWIEDIEKTFLIRYRMVLSSSHRKK